MGDAESIKAAFTDFSTEVRASLKEVVTSLGGVKEQQSAFGVQIGQLEETNRDFRKSIDAHSIQAAKMESSLEEVIKDTTLQWDHITAAKDAVRVPAKNAGFWDKDTKKLMITVSAVLIIAIMLLLAGQSGALKDIAGLF